MHIRPLIKPKAKLLSGLALVAVLAFFCWGKLVNPDSANPLTVSEPQNQAPVITTTVSLTKTFAPNNSLQSSKGFLSSVLNNEPDVKEALALLSPEKPLQNKNEVDEDAKELLAEARTGKSEREEEEGEDKDEYDGPGIAAEFEFERTRDPATNKIPAQGLMQAIEQTVRAKSLPVSSRTAALTWAERGPYTDAVGPTNGNTRPNNDVTSGRIRATWVDLSDNTGKTVWVGGVDGGIWKTTDITVPIPNWILVNDYLSNLAVTGICQDPTNHNTMYFCTGEAFINADRVQGNGVFKSTDAGATWTQLSSTTAYTYGSRIQCDALGNVYLGTNIISSGLVRSSDGGATWTNITPAGLTNRIPDFEISSTGRFHVAVGYHETGGGYRYTDNPSTVTSATWTAPTTPFAYPAGTYARVELACSGNVLYAVPSAVSTAVMSQIFKSIDGGATWAATPLTTQNITDLNGGSTPAQAWYCIGLEIDPSDANTAIVGGLNCLKTTDGGATWSKISEWVGTVGQYVHADIQNIKWYDNGNKLLIANDGGITYSSDKGVTFRDRNTNLRLKQFYSCAIHPNSVTHPNYFLAGAQDNGTHQLNGAGISSSVEVTGGDGAYVAIDQNEPQFQYGSYVFSNYRSSLNGGATWNYISFSNTGRFINPWDYDNVNNKIYGSTTAGSYFRWDNPQTATSVATSTRTTIAVPSFNGITVGAVMVSPYTANQVYFGTMSGTGGGRIVKVTNANTATPTDVNITGATMPAAAYANCINVGTNDDNLIVAFSNYGVNNVWITTDGGTGWTAIDGNLPDMPVRWAMFYPNDNTKAYIATETGVWGTDLINGASTVWVPNTSFPTVRTDMLKYRSSDRTIVAGTHGRGLWSAVIPNTATIPAPTVGAITQPTCTVATGSVALSGLPATGTWTLTRSPGAVTTTGTGTTTTVTGIPAGTYTFTVTNAVPETSLPSVNVVINAQPATPTAPSVGTITQPTCAVATGSVVLNGLPAGNWTINPGSITGSTTSTTIASLAAGTYNYTVTNAAGCISNASANVVISPQPTAPTAPSVGTITQPTCAAPTGSVILNGLPAAGTWTLTRSPGAVTSTGTGTTTTVTGLVAGTTYTFTVATTVGCTSAASANVVINAISGAPAAPSVGTTTQPTCAVATGSVVLNGLPVGTWTINPGAITGSTTSTTISSLAAGTYNYTVTNSIGCVSPASANIVINAQPVAITPSVGTITQPTCTVATGSVVLSGLPAGTWTINPGAITGSTTSTTISSLAAGTYNYTVTNAAGCTSPSSANVVINAQPATPTAPSVGTITQPTCAAPTGSVVLNGLPAGSWTIMPGNLTGTGTSRTVTGLVGGTYNFTVTNAAGCTSPASGNIVITAATGCCENTTLPTINLTSPTNGAVTATNLNFTATAADADGTVTGVNFYWVTGITKTGVVTRVLLGTDNTAPYTFTWMNIPGGNYNVQAEAVDNCNAKTFSTVSNVVVLETMSVIITSPLSSQGFVPGANITIASSVINYSARTVSKVEFYIGGVKVGEDLTAPYTFLWTNVQSGNYAISTKAIDNAGGVWSSPTYLITLAAGTINNGQAKIGNDNYQALGMTVAPNPTHGQAILSANIYQDGNYGLVVSDLIGKIVLSKKITCIKGVNSETLDVSNLAKGIYIVRLAHTETGEFAIQKLLID